VFIRREAGKTLKAMPAAWEDAASALEALRRLRESIETWPRTGWREAALTALEEEMAELETEAPYSVTN
jgi:hypothetical protein